MGGRPLFALNLVCWNASELPTEQLDELLAGAAEVAADCGFVIAGGHTVDDPVPKFGLSVTGEAHPEKLLRNAGLRDGDTLILTKPLGSGVVSTAAKASRADATAVAGMVTEMCRPNAEASRAALAAGATGATDVTGFGLLGHLGQMALTSGVDVTLDAASVPMLDGAAELAAAGYLPGGSRNNLTWARQRLEPGATDETTLALLADAQTSGGLLFGLAAGAAESTVERLRDSGHRCAAIGTARAGTGWIRLR
jgi:selenide,water dikinase